MAERLQLQLRRDTAADLADLVETQLSREDDAPGAEVVPRLRADVVGDGLLRADVPLAVGRVLPSEGERPEIRENQGVNPGGIELFEVGGQPLRLVKARHGVDRRVNAHAMCVRIGHGARQLIVVKVSRERAHAERGPRKVDGVRAVEHGHFQFFHIPRGGKKLRFSHGVIRWTGSPSC